MSFAPGQSLWKRGQRLPWWLYLLGLDAFFVFWTTYVSAGLPGARSLRPLNLASEVSVATWFSGFQLLLFALLAHSLSLHLRGRNAGAGRAYLVLSLIGLLLFADEMGSIHERAEFFMPVPSWLSMPILGLVAGVFLLWALYQMRRHRAFTGNAAWLVLAGFLAFAVVYVLEFVEGLRLSRAIKAVRYGAEEGTELLGILLLLAAIVSNKKMLGALTGGIRDFLPGRETFLWLARLCLFLCVPVIVLRAQFSAEELVIPRRGDFGATIPILLYAGAALMALERALNAGRTAWRWWLLAALLFVLSIDAEYHLHQLFEPGRRAGRLRSDVALLWTLPLLTAALLCAPAMRKMWVLIVAAATFALAVVSTGFSGDAPVLIVLPYITSFGVFFLLSRPQPLEEQR